MESKLYALLVGITDYPAKPLQGCLADVQALEAFLTRYQPDTTKRFLKTLTNEQATRQDVIDSFSHFEPAGPNDVCLFYFSGHGSFTTAPAGFYSPTNRFHQSLVCWDSRRPGGRDLMDKELAFLLWKYSTGRQKPGLRFVVITDSCHSGSVTREAVELTSGSMRERTLDPLMPAEAPDYYGFKEMVNGQHGYVISHENGKEQIRVQTGPHVHLAAARDSQTAKENALEGQIRGLFTYSLLKALQQSKGVISYSELIRRTELQLKNLVTDQNPMLSIESLPADTARNGFLQESDLPFARSNRVYFDAQKGWCIDVGSLLGASARDMVLLENGITTLITEVFPEESTVFEKPGLEQNQQYLATVIPQLNTKFALVPGLPAETRALLEQADTQGLPLTFVDSIDQQAHFQIQAQGDLVFVSGLADNTPLFKERPLEIAADATAFVDELLTFCTWNELLALQNPNATLTDSDIAVTVTVAVSAPAPTYDTDTFEPVADLTKPVELYYFNDESPAMQISIANRSGRELWFQPFYLGFDYGIDNQGLNAFSLKAGDATKLTMNVRQGPTDILRLRVDQKYRELGYTELTEYIKLIVATQPLKAGTLATYEQDGLKLAKRSEQGVKEGARGPGQIADKVTEDFTKDWITTTLAFRVSYPAKGASVADGSRYESPNLSIQTPAGFRTSFAWSSSGQITRSLSGTTPPDQVMGNASLQPFNWLATRGDAAPLNVLELYDFTNKEAVTPEQPLLIDFNTSSDVSNLVVLAIDPETGLYFAAGSGQENGSVSIHTLPDGSVTERSLGGSLKLFFYKVVLSKIGFTYTHPQLALATLADDLSVSYETDPDLIREALRPDSVKNILLFTHGIIGDTLDMTKAARLALTADGSPIETKIDAILTFDYENLNTRIQDNARLWKEALDRVGINAHDTKQVTIIAHSMGGLITRWMVEKLHGNEFIDRVILCGTPNEGTPLADVRDAVEVLLTFAVNGASFLKPWLFAINVLGKLGNEVSVSFRQMDMVTGIYTELNDKTDPRIPYTILAGDIRQIGLNLTDEMTLVQKLFTRLGRAAKYDLVDKLIFKASNDIAVGTKSIASIPGSEQWTKPPVTFTIACDHLNYFVNPASLSILGRLF